MDIPTLSGKVTLDTSSWNELREEIRADMIKDIKENGFDYDEIIEIMHQCNLSSENLLGFISEFIDESIDYEKRRTGGNLNTGIKKLTAIRNILAI